MFRGRSKLLHVRVTSALLPDHLTGVNSAPGILRAKPRHKPHVRTLFFRRILTPIHQVLFQTTKDSGIHFPKTLRKIQASIIIHIIKSVTTQHVSSNNNSHEFKISSRSLVSPDTFHVFADDHFRCLDNNSILFSTA